AWTARGACTRRAAVRVPDAHAVRSGNLLQAPNRDDLKDRGVYLAYRAGAIAAQSLPAPVGEAAARGIGRALGLAMQGRRRMSSRHLQRASGGTLRGLSLERAVNGAFESYARYWLEMFRLPYEGRAAIDEHFDVDGYEHIEHALAEGRGCILALPHL